MGQECVFTFSPAFSSLTGACRPASSGDYHYAERWLRAQRPELGDEPHGHREADFARSRRPRCHCKGESYVRSCAGVLRGAAGEIRVSLAGVFSRDVGVPLFSTRPRLRDKNAQARQNARIVMGCDALFFLYTPPLPSHWPVANIVAVRSMASYGTLSVH